MSINVWTDPMQHAELFGKPVLFTNWLILRDLVPKGWHCYDLQGTQNNPNGHAALVDRENIFHTGTILSPQPLKREGTVSRRVNGSFHLLGEEMTLEQFCEKHDLEYPQDTREFILRPASPDEAGLFYSMDAEEDRVLGTVGHLRIDFGHGGKEFWHTWWPHNDDQFNTPEFKDILQRFVDSLRQDGPLKDLKAMSTYCWQHGGPITEDKRSYGYLVEVGNYRLCLRCTPVMGDYQGYLYCYDLHQQELAQHRRIIGKATFTNGDQKEFTSAREYLQMIWEELPDRNITGFRFETLTDDPEVKKYLAEKLVQAENVLFALRQRESTMLRCARFVAAGQQAFFRDGPRALRPMYMTEAAQALDVHLSTVSRAVKDKYLQCRQGVFPLSYFFSAPAPDGSDVSRRAVLLQLRELIDGEDKAHPLSDEKLRCLLEQKGCVLSRRTVAKYREELGIPGTAGRRE